MDVEDLGAGVVSLDPPPTKDRESLLDRPAEMTLSGYPEYPKELVFLPMFSDPETLGGEWDPVNDELINLTTEPQEIKYAAANMRFLAALEEIPLEQFAPVADIYQDAYNRNIYGGKADTAKKFYTAVGESIQQKKKEEDEFDEQIIEKEWRDEHPLLAGALRIVNAFSGAALDLVGARPDNEAPLTNAETYEHYRRSSERLAGLSYKDFNPAGTVVQESGRHRLGLNWDGIAGLTVNWASGRAVSALSGETRAFNIRRGVDGRVSQVNAKINQTAGIKYDPETRRFYDGNGQIADSSIPEIIREKAIARGVRGTLQTFVPSDKVVGSTEASLAPSLAVDRGVEYYDRSRDIYYDRGYIIHGGDIEAYFIARDKLIQSNDLIYKGLESDGPGAMARYRYEPATYHGNLQSGRKSAGPKNGQEALDSSLRIKETSTRRVGIDYKAKEFVIFDETGNGVFHGHVRPWNGPKNEALPIDAKNTLYENGMVDLKGNILQ